MNSLEQQEKLPSIHREIKVQEKRMRTISLLEEKLDEFSKGLRDVVTICPFGHDSVEVQQLVNCAVASCTNLISDANAIHNLVQERHIKDMETLAEHEQLLENESSEDAFARLKSHVTEELDVSRFIRTIDKKRDKEFLKKLKELENQYFAQPRIPVNDENRGNVSYSVVE